MLSQNIVRAFMLSTAQWFCKEELEGSEPLMLDIAKQVGKDGGFIAQPSVVCLLYCGRHRSPESFSAALQALSLESSQGGIRRNAEEC